LLRFAAFAGFIYSSKQWGGNSTRSATRPCMMSLPVSVAAQKYAGLSAQPICKAEGTTMRMGWPGGSGMT
jgi:hypothetical protein